MINYIIAVIAAAIVAASVIHGIRSMKKGESGCGCGCEGCSSSKDCKS